MKMKVVLLTAVAMIDMTMLWILLIWQVFGSDVWNNLFLGLGVVLTALFVMCGIHWNGTTWKNWWLKVCRREISKGVGGWNAVTLRQLMQSVLLGGALRACIHYQDALSEYEHYVAIREMLIFIGLSLLVTFQKKEILHKINGAYLGGMVFIDVLYCQHSASHFGDAILARQNASIATIVGLLLLNFWMRRKELFHILRIRAGGYELLLLAYAGLACILANSRVWPAAMFLTFLFVVCRLLLVENGQKLWLYSVENGVVISYLYVVYFSLAHRPYHYFIYYRYPMIFHTVTMTSVYLSLVVIVGIVKLFRKIDRGLGISKMWMQIALVGSAFSYLIMTLSRNGYASVGCSMLILVAFLITRGKHKAIPQRIKQGCRTVGVIILCIVWMFPIVFTATRVIPAVVNQPYTYWIEPFSESIEKGEPWDSPRYMTIERLWETLGFKMKGSVEIADSLEWEKATDRVRIDFIRSNQFELIAYGEAELVGKRAESLEQYTNGRLDIFKSYLKQLNWKGHDIMGAVLPDGSLAVHAHNIFLQVAFDHGIIVGLLFGVFSFVTWMRAVVFYRKKNELLPLAITTVFLIIGMAEWITHMCNPLGCVFMMCICGMVLQKDQKAV